MKNCMSYRLHKPDRTEHFRWKNVYVQHATKTKKIIIKCAQHRRCTSSMCEQSL